MARSEQGSRIGTGGRLRLGIVVLALGIVCILSLAYAPGQVGTLDAIAALLGVAGLVAGTLSIGLSAPHHE